MATATSRDVIQDLSPRRPEEDGRRCSLCGGNDFHLLHAWEPGHPRNSAIISVGMWECVCGLAMLHPVPTEEELPESGEWWSKQRRQLHRNLPWKFLRANFQNRLFGTPRDRLIAQTRSAVPTGRLLDIGCGHGELLEQCRAHYDVVGLEPSPVAAASAREKGLTVIEGRLEDGVVEPESFDVAVMDSVLEHLPDPIVALRVVNSFLRPGGVVAIKVPKLRGPSFWRHGREWNGYRVGYHTFMFTGKTLAAVLERAGFEPLNRPRRDRLLDDILVMWGRKMSS